jgi:2-polyprenyl-6-methoxyphenol hydroxylase-like FAD-dependent oxidoreductase
MSRPASNPILIVGGGIGGLSLAQGLKRAAIPFRVFERDDGASFRAQGYRIRLGPNGIDSLAKLLPKPLLDLLGRACSDVVPGFHGYDAVTGAPRQGSGPPPGRPGGPGGPGAPGSVGTGWNADRVVLRNVLLMGLEGHVEFGKRFDRYEQDSDGVTAHFADGTSARGSLIIGADGVRSHVRKQVLPDYVVLDTETRAVFGKTPIPDGIFPPLHDTADKGITLTIDETQKAYVMLFSDGMKFHHDDATIPAGLLPEDYIYWVLGFNKDMSDVSDEELMAFDSARSAQFADDLSENWHPSIRAIIANQDREASSTLFFLMGRPDLVSKGNSSQVTLLGDAAHPMPPAGGVGANSALQDAADLFEALTNNTDTAAAVASYEKVLYAHACETLTGTEGAARKLFRMKPLEELKPANF